MDAAYKEGLCGQGWGMAGLTYFPLQNFSESLQHLALALFGGGIGGGGGAVHHVHIYSTGTPCFMSTVCDWCSTNKLLETQESSALAGVNWVLRWEDSGLLWHQECKQNSWDPKPVCSDGKIHTCSTKPCLKDTSNLQTGTLRSAAPFLALFLARDCQAKGDWHFRPSSSQPKNFAARRTAPLPQSHRKRSSQVQRQTAGRKGSAGPRGAGEGGPLSSGAGVGLWTPPLGMGGSSFCTGGGSCLLLNVTPDHVLVFLPRTLRELLWKNSASTREIWQKQPPWGENILWWFFPQTTTRITARVFRNNCKRSVSPKSGSPWRD